MAKTRSQALSSAVKKEEHESKPNVEQLLHSTNNASKTRNKITKNRKPIQTQNADVKSENEDDDKALLPSPKKKIFSRWKITAEQIAKLISYVVNDKMNVTEAAKKARLKYSTAYRYYKGYQDDPKHRVPLPTTRFNKKLSTLTQEKIEKLICFMVNDGMKITQASTKAEMNRRTATRYYAKYLEDPERKIPLLSDHTGSFLKRYTQDEIADLIGYIVRDKMTVVEASKKVNMSESTAKKYYLQYLHNPNHEIPDPHVSNHRSGKRYTKDQVKSLIGYIDNDGMTLSEASVKAHMCSTTASRYYQHYANGLDNNTPTSETDNICKPGNWSTLDQVKNFFCYIIIDKLSVSQAARKAKIPEYSGQEYYNKYLKSPKNQTKIRDTTYSADKMKRFVELVENEKMSLAKAAYTVYLNKETARKYYKQYLKDPQYEFPAIYQPQYTQEDIKRLIDYIKGDKMSVSSAAKIIKMSNATARRYYNMYKNDPKHRIPTPKNRGHTLRNKTFDQYRQMIADIYKNNPSIKPVHGNNDPELDILNIEVKEKMEEVDTKMALRDGK